MRPDETDEERLEKLPEDQDRPFTPDVPDTENNFSTRPETDSNMDSTEVYQEGVAGAAEIEEPNKGDTVEGYTPPEENDMDEAL